MTSIKTAYWLFILPLFLLASCQTRSGQQETQPVKIDSLFIGNLDTVITTESASLGRPRELVAMDEHRFAVYDHGFKRITVFNNQGKKQYAFGAVGKGPGEWDAMSGAADLDFLEGRFFATNRSRYRFDLFDKEGRHLKSIPFPQYLANSHKTLLPGNKLLVATGGREDALAVVLDLDEAGTIVRKIGTPESEYAEERNFNRQRSAYSEGNVPESARNKALVAAGTDGYFLFMNTLGVLRRYSDDGVLVMQQEIPDNIKRARFDFVVTRNKEITREHTVVPLHYAQDLQVHNGLIYLFMPKPHPEAEGLNHRILVYSTGGKLQNHYVFTDPEQESFLYEFMIDNDNTLYFIDFLKARILRFSSGAQ